MAGAGRGFRTFADPGWLGCDAGCISGGATAGPGCAVHPPPGCGLLTLLLSLTPDVQDEAGADVARLKTVGDLMLDLELEQRRTGELSGGLLDAGLPAGEEGAVGDPQTRTMEEQHFDAEVDAAVAMAQATALAEQPWH